MTRRAAVFITFFYWHKMMDMAELSKADVKVIGLICLVTGHSEEE